MLRGCDLATEAKREEQSEEERRGTESRDGEKEGSKRSVVSGNDCGMVVDEMRDGDGGEAGLLVARCSC